MLRLILPAALLVLPMWLHAQRTRALEQLATTLAGSYTSAEQAQADTAYFDIELEMVRIWPKRKDGAWFYVEQATAEAKSKPYRQRVYHLQELNDSTFTSRILMIKGGASLFGAYREPVLLEHLSMDSLVALEGCDITLHHRGAVYEGATAKGSCPSTRQGASYTTSEVVLAPGRMVSWDRGWDSEGVQAWGATKGGYIFIKRTALTGR